MKDEGGSSSFALGKKTKIGRLCEGRLLTLLVYDGVYVTVRCPSVRLTVHLSVCLSVCPILLRSRGVRRVCCCGPDGRQISIDGGGRPAVTAPQHG